MTLSVDLVFSFRSPFNYLALRMAQLEGRARGRAGGLKGLAKR